MGIETLDQFSNSASGYVTQEPGTMTGEWEQAPISLRISQYQVDRFVESTKDSNPIHGRDSDRPIVPGMLLASLFRGFFNRDPVEMKDHVVVLSRVLSLRLDRAVRVGTLVSLKYRFCSAVVEGRMYRVPCEFEIYAHPEVGQPVKALAASFELVLMPKRMFEFLIGAAV